MADMPLAVDLGITKRPNGEKATNQKREGAGEEEKLRGKEDSNPGSNAGHTHKRLREDEDNASQSEVDCPPPPIKRLHIEGRSTSIPWRWVLIGHVVEIVIMRSMLVESLY